MAFNRLLLASRLDSSLTKFVGRALLVTLASIIGAIAAFLTQLLLARNLTVADMGVISSTLAIMAFATPIAGLGIPQVLLKLYGRDPRSLLIWRQQIIIVGFWSTILVMSILGGIFAILTRLDLVQDLTIPLLLIAFVPSQVAVELLNAKLKMSNQISLLAGLQCAPQCLRLLCITGAILLVPAEELAIGVAGAYAAAALFIVATFASYCMRAERGGSLSPTTPLPDSTLASSLVKESWPFMAATLCHLVYFQANIVLLRFMVGAEAAGVYAVAFAIISASYLLPGVIYQRLLQASMHSWAYHRPDKLRKAYWIGNYTMAATGLVSSVFLAIFALIGLVPVFGAKYQEAVVVLLILSLSVPLRFVSNSPGSVLATRGNIHLKLRSMLTVAIVGLAVSTAAIKSFGVYGAAAAMFVSEALLLTLLFWRSNQALRTQGESE